MKMIIALAALVAVAVAAPAEPQAQLVEETPLDNIGVGDYKFGYTLSNGQAVQESGQLKNAGSEKESLVVTGSFSWTDPQTNVRYTITYTADEDGFHPQGAHIPV